MSIFLNEIIIANLILTIMLILIFSSSLSLFVTSIRLYHIGIGLSTILNYLSSHKFDLYLNISLPFVKELVYLSSEIFELHIIVLSRFCD